MKTYKKITDLIGGTPFSAFGYSGVFFRGQVGWHKGHTEHLYRIRFEKRGQQL